MPPEARVPETLITWYLHMTDPAQFVPAAPADADDDVVMLALRQPDVRYYKFLYTAVGEAWRWRDRIIMPEDELAGLIARPNVSIHVMYVRGAPAGYFELVSEADKSTELAYFGLRPGFVGRGYGKALLSAAIARAWDEGAARIWVHTCNLDAPGALPNYQKRGFVIYDTIEESMPERYL